MFNFRIPPVVVLVLIGAILGGILLSAVPALLGNAPLTKTLGLAGTAIGAVGGFFYADATDQT